MRLTELFRLHPPGLAANCRRQRQELFEVGFPTMPDPSEGRAAVAPVLPKIARLRAEEARPSQGPRRRSHVKWHGGAPDAARKPCLPTATTHAQAPTNRSLAAG